MSNRKQQRRSVTNFDDHYAKSSPQNRAEELRLRQYNRWVEIVRTATKHMVEAAQGKEPQICEWVYEEGKRRASWRLFTERKEGSYRIHLMPDGRLVRVEDTTIRNQSPAVKKVISLRPISRQSEEIEIGVSWDTLAKLCSAVVMVGLPRFHLPSPRRFQNDLLANWYVTYPLDKVTTR